MVEKRIGQRNKRFIIKVYLTEESSKEVNRRNGGRNINRVQE
jgi:hypothetical protein